MKTEILPSDAEGIRRAAEAIRRGEVVGMPTETVYGLAANALNPEAVQKIFAAKGRPADNPLIVHIADMNGLNQIAREIPAAAEQLMQAYWPGPMTLILPRKACVPDIVTAGLDTVGIRMPSSAPARALIAASGCPIAAPSANTSGKPSPTTAMHVYHDMNGKIPIIVDGGPCQVGLESTVIDVTGERPVILRPGGITAEMIESVTHCVEIDKHVLSPLSEGETVKSPGMKYKHYAPEARITIFEGEAERVHERICSAYDEAMRQGERAAILAFDEHAFGNRRVFSLGSAVHQDQAASKLFGVLRELDEQKLTAVFSEAASVEGIGLAVMNRLGRAAGFHIERV